MKVIDTNFPVDALVYTPHGLAAASYNYKDGSRSGDIKIYNSCGVTLELPTQGTFDLKYKDNFLVSANTDGIMVYGISSKEEINLHTPYMNTYVSFDNDKSAYDTVLRAQDSAFPTNNGETISNALSAQAMTDLATDSGGSSSDLTTFVASTFTGYVNVYNNLRMIDSIKLSEDVIWVTEYYTNLLVSGCEDGRLVFKDLRSTGIIKQLDRKSTITSIFREDNLIYVGSYDEFIEIIDIRDYSIVRKERIGGGIWRIKKKNDRLYTACMYDGMKILDDNLSTVAKFNTKSIVYALDVSDSEVAFSSFYDKKIFVNRIEIDQKQAYKLYNLS